MRSGPARSGQVPADEAFQLLGKIYGRVEDTFIAANGHVLPLPHTVVKNLVGL
jgi:phenylacetate-CoA ligase